MNAATNTTAKAAEDESSVESLLSFLRDGVESYDKKGPAAFPDLAHLFMNDYLDGAMKTWALNLERSNDPESAQRYANCQEAALLLLIEKAQAIRDTLASGREANDEQKTQLLYVLSIVNAFKVPGSREIVGNLLSPNCNGLSTPQP